MIPVILFYVFSFILLSSAIMVISSSNPVHSVLFLILAFFNAAGLFILAGAELIAMLLVIVYVGAVAVLFLFVVMMLDINFVKLREGFLRYLPLGLLLAAVIFAELYLVLDQSVTTINLSMVRNASALPISPAVPNTQAIGAVLYTKYIYVFQLSGLVLLVAMIGAIVLTSRHREGVKRQNIGRQVSRKVKDSVVLVKIKPGEGV